AIADRWLPGRPRAAQVRAEFARRTPAARDRAFLQADMSLLRAAVEIHDKDSSLEIARLGAVRLMIRNCAVPLAAAGTAAIWQSRRFRRWWYMKTLETCYWIPAIDQAIINTAKPAIPRQQRSAS